MFKLAAMFKPRGHTLASLFSTMLLTACATPPTHADNIYINTMISGELMPGVYGQVNIGSVPDYVTVYEEPMLIVQQPVYAVPMQPVYLYVPPYHAYHWRDHCGYYNACARPVYFVCARDYRPHYFESRYYNTRIYNPPRVYHHHAGHNHNRHYQTMHQREMNRDSRYHRVDGNKGPYYRENSSRENNYYRHNNDKNHQYRQGDDRRDDGRHQQRNDKQPSRQQYINNHQNGGNGQQSNRRHVPTQQGTTTQPQRNDAVRIRSDNYRPANYQPSNQYRPNNQSQQNGNQNARRDIRQTEYRPAANRVQTNDYRPRERAQAPVQQSRQPSFNNSQNQQRSVGRYQGGGQHERPREERR